jgi:hypothetical protein
MYTQVDSQPSNAKIASSGRIVCNDGLPTSPDAWRLCGTAAKVPSQRLLCCSDEPALGTLAHESVRAPR